MSHHTSPDDIRPGDWVTNNHELLGEPHEVIEITQYQDVICVESVGHVTTAPLGTVWKVKQP